MSKMPSKKKSCFQITSVTQAQVAANSMTDEPESLDESRTEGVASSDMYDVGKSVEFETCDVTSSDDPPRNDLETCGVNAHEGLAAPGPRNPGAVGINPNVRGVQGLMVTAPGSSQHSPGSGSVAHTSFSSSATVSSCTSRFRVIKLDHSTGDPFKRGRWTCSEFYEKDTDASSSGRAAETVRHTLVNGVDKDAHGGSPGVLSTPAAEPHADSGYASAPSNPSAEHQSPCLAQPGVSITSPGVFPVGTGGAHMHHVKSPSMPPGSQPQTLYQGKQAQNSEFRPQHTLDGSSLASPPLGVPVMTPAVGGSHILGLVPQSVDAVGHGGGPDHAQGLLQQPGVGSAPGTASAPAVVPQTSVPLIQPAGTVSFTPHTVVPGVQNVPVVKSSASNNPHSMPNQTPVPVAQSQQNQPQGIPGGLVVGLGMHNSAFSFSQFPTGITQAEDKRRKSDALPHSTVIIGKDVTKTLNADGFHLSTPAVKSLFGISIPIDGDEDRNPSTAFYQAFPNCKSKVISDGYDSVCIKLSTFGGHDCSWTAVSMTFRK